MLRSEFDTLSFLHDACFGCIITGDRCRPIRGAPCGTAGDAGGHVGSGVPGRRRRSRRRLHSSCRLGHARAAALHATSCDGAHDVAQCGLHAALHNSVAGAIWPPQSLQRVTILQMFIRDGKLLDGGPWGCVVWRSSLCCAVRLKTAKLKSSLKI